METKQLKRISESFSWKSVMVTHWGNINGLWPLLFSWGLFLKDQKKNAHCIYFCVVILGINLLEIPVLFSASFKICYTHLSALKVWCNPKHPTGAESLIYPEACHRSRPLTLAPQHHGMYSAHVACQPGAPVHLSPTPTEWRQKMAQICLHPLLCVNTVIARYLPCASEAGRMFSYLSLHKKPSRNICSEWQEVWDMAVGAINWHEL